jgi:hypothetical protein
MGPDSLQIRRASGPHYLQMGPHSVQPAYKQPTGPTFAAHPSEPYASEPLSQDLTTDVLYKGGVQWKQSFWVGTYARFSRFKLNTIRSEKVGDAFYVDKCPSVMLFAIIVGQSRCLWSGGR